MKTFAYEQFLNLMVVIEAIEDEIQSYENYICPQGSSSSEEHLQKNSEILRGRLTEKRNELFNYSRRRRI